jgi:hypothetical protein
MLPAACTHVVALKFTPYTLQAFLTAFLALLPALLQALLSALQALLTDLLPGVTYSTPYSQGRSLVRDPFSSRSQAPAALTDPAALLSPDSGLVSAMLALVQCLRR